MERKQTSIKIQWDAEIRQICILAQDIGKKVQIDMTGAMTNPTNADLRLWKRDSRKV